MKMEISKKRNFGLDLLRVIACYMVIQVHAGEFFYIGEGDSVIAGNNAFWVNIYNSVGRAAVPLFIMITGCFILPLKMEMGPFFRRRFTRVAIPFILWCILYAFYNVLWNGGDIQEAFVNILNIPINYGTQVGHLWYIYMLMGLYLFAPVISPFLRSATQKGILFYLSLWTISLFLPYIHQVFPGVWGECFWNNTPMLYYFSGFLGYAVLGYYIKAYCDKPGKNNLLVGILLLIVGYIITYTGFSQRLSSAEYVSELELTWGYGTINVAMMGLGLMLIIKNVKCNNGRICKLITQMSLLSYGVYLVHIMLLNFFYDHLIEMMPQAKVSVPVLAVLTFISSYIIVKIISFLPKSKYLIG